VAAFTLSSPQSSSQTPSVGTRHCARPAPTGAPMQRLTIAQDTGGAIRGAVRADYFFGNGQQAATNARRMKERGQLWILLPRGLAVASAAVSSAIRTRGAPVGAGLAQCLVPTEGVCEDD
jgi:membrane-bound lytic murein transglycosylase A